MNDLGGFLCCFPAYFIIMYPGLESVIKREGNKDDTQEILKQLSQTTSKQEESSTTTKQVEEILGQKSVDEILDTLNRSDLEKRRDQEDRYRQLY